MDNSSLEKIADFICGDIKEKYPVCRTGDELSRFFERAGLNKNHNGSTRKRWTLETLKQLKGDELQRVILRLASPKEYGGDKENIKIALKSLNEILEIESLKVSIRGVEPILEKAKPNYNFENIEKEIKKEKVESANERELKPLPPPDFYTLGIESPVAEILLQRWNETQKCIDSKAYLASIILMGSLLEGFLLGILQKNPQKANMDKNAPKDNKTGKIKHFSEWKLSEMIDVAHSVGWIELDVKKFSHSLREFRNLIHPYEQMSLRANPDEDTCKISWLVVQAACNDIAKNNRQK